MFNVCGLRRGVRLLLGVAALAGGPRIASAHALPPLSLEQLVDHSDATLLGHTLSLRSFWQGSRIVTVTRVAIDELWAGSVQGASSIDVVTLGGAVGELGQRVDGAGEVPAYGRVVLHVARTGGGEYAPYAMAEGVWQVESLWGDGGAVRREVPLSRAGRGGVLALAFAAHAHGTVGELRHAVRQVASGRDEHRR